VQGVLCFDVISLKNHMLRILVIAFILISCGNKEAHFIIRNKDEIPLTDVFVIVNPNDSIPLFK